MEAYKVFTKSLCSPIRGGEPVWDGTLPHRLPTVEVDTSEEECAAGWSACRTPEDALRIAGMCPDGRPSRVFCCDAVPDCPVAARGDKLRAASWRLVSELTEEEIGQAVLRFSERYLSRHAAVMADEQVAWRAALARPRHDPVVVERELRAALLARGLSWKLRRFGSDKDAGDIRDTGASMYDWVDWSARSARASWDGSDACSAWEGSDYWDVWNAFFPRDAWSSSAVWTSRVAMAARAAWMALATQYMALCGHLQCAADRHTVGIREAYRHGLAIALPIGNDQLGWAMIL
jgi:hypothetical protein